MYDQPVLSEAEWALVSDLLKQERDELPAELHHCRSAEYHDALRSRQDMVNDLLARLRVETVV